MTNINMPETIYLRTAWRGYEVRYNVADDVIEYRRLREVTEEVGESDDGLRSGATITCLRGQGEWRADYAFDEELLAEGREKAAALRATLEEKARTEAEKAAARAALTPMTIEVDAEAGTVRIDGEELDIEGFLGGYMEMQRFFPGRCLEGKYFTAFIYDGPGVAAREVNGGVEVTIGYPE